MTRTRSPLYIYHGPGQVASRVSGLVMDVHEATQAIAGHLDLAKTAPTKAEAAAHFACAGDLVTALRQINRALGEAA